MYGQGIQWDDVKDVYMANLKREYEKRLASGYFEPGGEGWEDICDACEIYRNCQIERNRDESYDPTDDWKYYPDSEVRFA